jgi:hypothetical protein
MCKMRPWQHQVLWREQEPLHQFPQNPLMMLVMSHEISPSNIPIKYPHPISPSISYWMPSNHHFYPLFTEPTEPMPGLSKEAELWALSAVGVTELMGREMGPMPCFFFIPMRMENIWY